MIIVKLYYIDEITQVNQVIFVNSFYQILIATILTCNRILCLL